MLCHSHYKSVRRAEAESIDWNMFSVNSRCSRMFYVCSTKGIVSSMRHFLFLWTTLSKTWVSCCNFRGKTNARRMTIFTCLHMNHFSFRLAFRLFGSPEFRHFQPWLGKVGGKLRKPTKMQGGLTSPFTPGGSFYSSQYTCNGRIGGQP